MVDSLFLSAVAPDGPIDKYTHAASVWLRLPFPLLCGTHTDSCENGGGGGEMTHPHYRFVPASVLG